MRISKPRYVREMRLIPWKHGFIVDGGPHLSVLETNGIGSHLTALLERADGRHSLEELYSAIAPHQSSIVASHLDTLYRAGLIEEGMEPVRNSSMSSDMLSALRRARVTDRAYRGAASMAELLAQRAVILVSCKTLDSYWKLLLDVLSESGVYAKSITLEEISEGTVVSEVFEGSYVVCLDKISDSTTLSSIASSSTACVFIEFDAQKEEMAIIPWHLARHLSGPAQEPIPMSSWILFKGIAFLAYWLVQEILDQPHGVVKDSVVRIDLSHFRAKRKHIYGLANVSRNLDLLCQFEESLRESSKRRTWVTGESSGLLSLRHESKIMRCSAGIESDQWCEKSQEWPMGTLNRSATQVYRLSQLLLFGNGVRTVDQSATRRWCASAGNMGSQELYVVPLNIDGLDPGVYFYENATHRLAVVQRKNRALEVQDLCARHVAWRHGREPEALIIATGALRRLGAKYGPFSYRLLFQDAGVLFGQMAQLAGALGFKICIANTWDEPYLQHQLGLQDNEELVTLVFEVHDIRRMEAHPISGRQFAPARHFMSELEPLDRSYQELSSMELLRAVIEHSQLTTFPVRDLKLSFGGFDNPDTEQSSLDTYLSTRKSTRLFAPVPVSRQAIVDVISAKIFGLLREERGWLRAVVMVRHARDLAPAIYQVEDGAFNVLRDLPTDNEWETLYVQGELASAPVAIWLIGDLSSAVNDMGRWAHRYLLVRSGQLAQEMTFNIYTNGWDGAIVGGVISDQARNAMGLTDSAQIPLIAVVFGRGLKQGS